MDFQVWQAAFALLIPASTLYVTWRHNTASISHQRTQRLRDLVHSGEWRKAHPLVLVMDVREAFNMRINLDARALRLALGYQDHAYAALKDYLVARDFVHISEDGRRFQRMAQGNNAKTYGNLPLYVILIGLGVYTAFMALHFYLGGLGQPEAWLAFLPAVLCLLLSMKLTFSLSAANRLFKLSPPDQSDAVQSVFEDIERAH